MSAPSAIAARTDPYRDNRPERVYEVRYLDTPGSPSTDPRAITK